MNREASALKRFGERWVLGLRREIHAEAVDSFHSRGCNIRIPWFTLAVMLTCAGVLVGADRGAGQGSEPAYRNSAPGVPYVGSQVCASCHRPIYDEYIRTDMGRSLAEISVADLPRAVESRPSIFDSGSALYFQVIRRGQELFESVYGSDAAGEETFRHTEKIAYSMGNGANGICYLIRKGNRLFEAPVAFYTKTQAWDLAPG